MSVQADVEGSLPDMASVQVKHCVCSGRCRRVTAGYGVCSGLTLCLFRPMLKGHCRIWRLFRFNIVSVQADVEGSIPDMASVQV